MLFAGKAISPGTGHAEGRRLLEDLYRQYRGSALPPVLLTDRGKPYLENGPFFSVTHTDRHAFCALSDVPIGIDAEELDRNIDLRLANKILSPSELDQYRQAEDKRLALLTFWVLKEALAKCTGKGLCSETRHTDFSLNDPRISIRSGCLIAIIEEER